jgi:replicative DNA helicase
MNNAYVFKTGSEITGLSSPSTGTQAGLARQTPTIKTHSPRDVFWDKITSIEPDGIEAVYDLTVEPRHNFIAN